MSAYKVKVGDKEYLVKIVKELEQAIEVEINGNVITVAVETSSLEKREQPKPAEAPRREISSPPTAPSTPAAPAPPPAPAVPLPPAHATGVITARVPGKVKEIKVTEGLSVKRGQTLVIVESMKMEIEIKSDRDGTVKNIYVKPGQFVSPGAPLVLLE